MAMDPELHGLERSTYWSKLLRARQRCVPHRAEGTLNESPQTLEETGFKIGDLVLYECGKKDATGGVIFRIVERTDPIVPTTTSRIVKKTWQRYKSPSMWGVKRDHSNSEIEVYVEDQEIYGSWDANGKKILEAATYGFVRIRPVFDFFVSSRMKNPFGKGQTIIVHYRHMQGWLRHVDLVLLGLKYVELGNIMREIASANLE